MLSFDVAVFINHISITDNPLGVGSMTMKTLRLGVIVFPLLAGCVPQTQDGFWREGVSYQKMKSDRTDCSVAALKSVPREEAVQSVPGSVMPTQVSPITTQCYGYGAYGSCMTTGGVVSGGQVVGGRVFTYDQNETLRNQVVEQCLAKRGYQRAVIPTCNADQAKQSGTSNKLPKLNDVLCVVEDASREQRVNLRFVMKPPA